MVVMRKGKATFGKAEERKAKQSKEKLGPAPATIGLVGVIAGLTSHPARGGCNIMEELCWGIRVGDGAYPPLLDHPAFFWLKQLACRPALHLPFLGASPFPHLLLRSSRPVTVTRIRSSLSNSTLRRFSLHAGCKQLASLLFSFPSPRPLLVSLFIRLLLALKYRCN